MTTIVIWLNALANACAEYALAPLAVLPGWLSATLVAGVTGVIMLLIFKYTSKQDSVKDVRDSIKANLLALSLFRDSAVVSLRCQANVLAGAFRLLLLAVVPMLVMTVPMCLLLAQLAVWYQARPLHIGEETVVTAFLADASNEMNDVHLEANPAAEVTVGPVRIPSKHMICWNVRATQKGYHQLKLDVGEQSFAKQLAVGDGFMRVSLRRPTRSWEEALLHPCETPFARNSAVQAVEIDYPDRLGWTSGTDYWVVYWFVVSMIAAFCIRPWLKVNI